METGAPAVEMTVVNPIVVERDSRLRMITSKRERGGAGGRDRTAAVDAAAQHIQQTSRTDKNTMKEGGAEARCHTVTRQGLRHQWPIEPSATKSPEVDSRHCVDAIVPGRSSRLQGLLKILWKR